MERENILIYAQGGGLGHLQRSIYLIKTLQLPKEKVILASSSDYTKTIADLHQISYLIIPKNYEFDKLAYQKWLLAQINYLKIKYLYLDVFPCGIIGEWNNYNFFMENKAIKDELIFHYVARRMKWQHYKNLAIYPPFFETTFLLEDLEPAHLEFVENNSNLIVNTFLKNETVVFEQKKEIENEESFWLIIHSEPLEELAILITHCFEKYQIQKAKSKIIVVTQIEKNKIMETFLEHIIRINTDESSKKIVNKFISNLLTINTLETNLLIEKADKIFSACGFNVMKQTEKFANKHEFIPFERRYDDQFWRAKQRKIICRF